MHYALTDYYSTVRTEVKPSATRFGSIKLKTGGSPMKPKAPKQVGIHYDARQEKDDGQDCFDLGIGANKSIYIRGFNWDKGRQFGVRVPKP